MDRFFQFQFLEIIEPLFINLKLDLKVLRPVHACSVCHVVTTALSLKTSYGQIEHIEINYDAHTNAVRPHARGLPVGHIFTSVF